MKIIPLDNCYEAYQKNIYATIYIDTEKKKLFNARFIQIQ